MDIPCNFNGKSKELISNSPQTLLALLGLALMLSTSSAAPAPEPAPFTPEFVLGTLFGLYKYHLLSLAAGNNRGSVLGLSSRASDSAARPQQRVRPINY